MFSNGERDLLTFQTIVLSRIVISVIEQIHPKSCKSNARLFNFRGNIKEPQFSNVYLIALGLPHRKEKFRSHVQTN